MLTEDDEKFLISACIPDFVPIQNSQSLIIDEIGIKMLTLHLPPLIRMRDWERVFSIDSEGTSMISYYNCLKEHDETIILIKDSEDSVFGAYVNERWHYDKKFYGSAESFVFNFDIEKH